MGVLSEKRIRINALTMKAARYFVLIAGVVGLVAILWVGRKPGSEAASPPGVQDQRVPRFAAARVDPAQEAHGGSRLVTSGAKRAPSAPFFRGSPSGANSPPGASFTRSDFPPSEQQSLWTAFSEARREVRTIPASRAHNPENMGYEFYALHPNQNLTTRFGEEGFQLVSSDRTYTEEDARHPSTSWQARMRLVSLAGDAIPARTPPNQSDRLGSLVEFRHRPGLTEWVHNAADGIEHGYTIASRPSHLRKDEQIRMEVALEGLHAARRGGESGEEALVFLHGEREVLSYSKLRVMDAQGKELPSTMFPTEGGFALAYNDAQAVYPVTVDPLIVHEEPKFNRLDVEANDRFGWSVDISPPFAVVGAYGDDDAGSNSGSAYVFFRVDRDTWILQAKLVAEDAAAGDSFGESVAISGTSVAVGAYGDDDGGSSSGSAYVFIREESAWTQQAKLTADDAAEDDHFGRSLALSGDTVVAGASGDDDGGTSSGSAYVFTREGSLWTQQAKLTANDPTAYDLFGTVVDVAGDVVAVGAPKDDDGGSDAGSVYVFARNGSTWDQQAELTADDSNDDDRFGAAVAISGDSLLVGASQDDDGGSASGSAYVFIRDGSTWTQQAKLVADDAAAGDRLGLAVGISGDAVVVGAYRNDDNGTDSGSAYIFGRSGSTWTQQEKLVADDAAAEDGFGRAVAIFGDSVVVGAYGNDNAGSNSGSAYLYTRGAGGWILRARLVGGDAADHDYFGTSVAISGDTLVVGASHDDDGGSGSGSAYLFVRNGLIWSQQAKLTADDATGNDRFGRSVAISGDIVIVGASGDSHAGTSSGSAYIFARNGSTWAQQTKLTAPDAAKWAYFGISVAVSGDAVAVGAKGDNNDAGGVYLYTRAGSTWALQTKLTASDADSGDEFGRSVAMSPDGMVVGAPKGEAVEHLFSGSAYIFARAGDTWVQQAKLAADDAGEWDYFGSSVAISGNAVAVGAYADNDHGSDSGSVYLFARDGATWSQQAKLIAHDAASEDRFGHAVSMSGDTVVVGAYGDDDAGPLSGSAYVFAHNGSTWTQQAKLTAYDATERDSFGYAVAMSGGTVIVGALDDDDGGPSSGSMYVFNVYAEGVSKLAAFDHQARQLTNQGAASPFPGQQTGTTKRFVFRIASIGESTLDLQSVSLGGPDATQFGLELPDLSSAQDLAYGESLDVSIAFAPVGGTGPRAATVIITSNDPATPIFTCALSGLALSIDADTDGDGLHDWGEHSLRGFGFDWQTPQVNRVNDLQEFASEAGLYTPSQAAGVQADMRLLYVDPVSRTVAVVIGLEESEDLEQFDPILADPARLSVDGSGRIRYELDTPADKKFYRGEWD